MTDFEYAIHDGHIEIVKYTGTVSEVLIPSTIDGLPVTHIGDSAFWCRKHLTSVTIPESVTHIGKKAFYWCESLTSIQLPENLTHLGERAFFLCKSLPSVTIPASVSHIGGGAFSLCWKLREIFVSSKNSHFKSIDGILFTIDGKILIQVPAGISLTEYTTPDGVETIGGGAFAGCGLLSVNIPDSVTVIEDYAFSECANLIFMTFPRNLINIGENAFSKCFCLVIHASKGSPAQKYAKKREIPFSTDPLPFCGTDGAWYSSDRKTILGVPRSISGKCIIPNRVSVIGKGAFSKCVSLTSITIPNSVVSIENFAFFRCESLTSVTIPNSVTDIGDGAFNSCRNLTTVEIPENVMHIGDYAFNWCHNLTIVGRSETAAEWYANKEGIPFQKTDQACQLPPS
ncbi:MAG: leucine-rich repeat domain-containing protein [Thermoguttaceae bacterium]|nr:leucine-rich repeat domain-containing protein [Thermoguttaceae bacterium]